VIKLLHGHANFFERLAADQTSLSIYVANETLGLAGRVRARSGLHIRITATADPRQGRIGGDAAASCAPQPDGSGETARDRSPS
jgi:hypothetical protein